MPGKVLQVLLVDDDPSSREELKQHLAAIPDVSVVGEAGDTNAAILQLRSQPVDLVFLDIELGRDSGFRLAQHIHTAFPTCLVVFLTGHVDFALEGYEYGPVDFLIKPVNLIRLEQAILRVRERLDLYPKEDADEDLSIGIQSGHQLEIVDIRKILYLEKRGWKVQLVLEDGSSLATRDSLQSLEPDFLRRGFFRCHQSFLIPVRRIRSVQMDQSKNTYSIRLEGIDTPIPLSRDKVAPLRQLLSERGMGIH